MVRAAREVSSQGRTAHRRSVSSHRVPSPGSSSQCSGGTASPSLARGDRRRRDLDALVIAIESPAAARDAIRDARNDYPSARLVLVVDTATPAEARHMLIDDVPGLVIAEQADATLALAVRAARAGHISYPAELMPNRMRGALSKREKQILGMVVMGFSNAEIAAKLHISESTVKSHLSSAFAILGVRSRKEAAALILDPNAGFGTGILAITDSG